MGVDPRDQPLAEVCSPIMAQQKLRLFIVDLDKHA